MTEIKSRKLKISQVMENKILHKIVEITNSELSLEKVLRETVKIITEFTKADSVFIYLLDRTTKQLSLMASKTPHKKDIGNVALKVGEGVAGWVLRNASSVAISENAYKDNRFKSFDVLPEDKYEALLSVPIINKGKAVGVVNVQHKKSHEYSDKIIDLISLIAKQIDGVIENARLYEDAKKKAVQFDSLVKVSNSITSKNYLDEILSLIVVVTAEILNSKICSKSVVISAILCRLDWLPKVYHETMLFHSLGTNGQYLALSPLRTPRARPTPRCASADQRSPTRGRGAQSPEPAL